MILVDSSLIFLQFRLILLLMPKSALISHYLYAYATRYPEAVPLCKATLQNFAREMFLLSINVRIPKDIPK